MVLWVSAIFAYFSSVLAAAKIQSDLGHEV